MKKENKKVEKKTAVKVVEPRQEVGPYDNNFVVLKDVNKIYDNNFHAVHNFNLTIKKNEFVVFVGPSGCGKSTTLRMIAGLEDISSGELYINGEYSNDLLSKDRDIAMVFQNYALYPNMTVYENMSFGIKIRKHLMPVIGKDGKPVMKVDEQKVKEFDESISKIENDIFGLQNELTSLLESNEEVNARLLETEELLGINYKNEGLLIHDYKKRLDVISKTIADYKKKAAKLDESLYGKKVNKKVEDQKAEIRSLKRELDDVLYDADEYYSYNQVEARINSLTKQLEETKDRQVKAELKNRIKKLSNRLSKLDPEAKPQIKEVGGFEKRINKLTKSVNCKEVVAGANANLKFLKGKVKLVENNNKKINQTNFAIRSKSEALDRNNVQREEALKEFSVPVMKMRHLTRAEIDAKVNEAAKILEISDQLKKKPKELSGGQRQRVALGRAIVRNARIFLMDEPLSNLDAKLRVQMRSEIIKLHKQVKATTIYVTHDQTEAMTMADRIVLMKLGYVQQIGKPIEIYRNPANLFVASFIGSPAMNLIDATYDKGRIIFKDKNVYKLSKAQITAHDKFYTAKYLEESRGYDAFIERLNKEKEAFNKKHHLSKDVKEFNEKYNKLIKDKKALIKNLETISKGSKHPVIFGIRPEDIVQCGPKDEGAMKVTIKLSELLGDHYFLHFNYGDKDVLSKVQTEKILNAGQTINLRINSHNVHLFDTLTELAIK